jgi:UDP-N-acetylglucosamine 2-epimerase (non-hydrolysing)
MPEAVKMAPVVCELRRRMGADRYDCQVWWTGQHSYGAVDRNVLTHFHIRAEAVRDSILDGTLAFGLARMIRWLSDVGAKRTPDIVIAAGDTTSVAAAALFAFYSKTPFAHVEAGLRTLNISAPFPEELHRRLSDDIATWRFTPTPKAQGTFGRIESAYMVGNTVIDAVDAMDAKHEIVHMCGNHIVLTCHRREATAARMQAVFKAVGEFCRRYTSIRVMLPMHPGLGREVIAEDAFDGLRTRVKLCPIMEYPEFLRMLAACRFVVTDSGGLQEEACRLGKRCVVVREETERGEAIGPDANHLVGYDEERILEAMELFHRRPVTRAHRDTFGDGHAAERIADVLLGH